MAQCMFCEPFTSNCTVTIRSLMLFIISEPKPFNHEINGTG